MAKRFLVGKQISMHGLTEEYIATSGPYFSWLDDLSLDTHTERSRRPNSEARARAYFERAQTGSDLVLLGIFDNKSDKHIGNLSLQDIDPVSGRAHLGYLIGDKAFHGKGIATEAVLMGMYYGFLKMNLRRIYTHISVENLASIRVAEKAGMLIEGTWRQHFWINHRGIDAVLYGALYSQWQKSHLKAAEECFENPPF